MELKFYNSEMAEVTFLCKRTIVSTKPIQPGLCYPLSVLDHVMEPSNLRIVYYYRLPSDNEPGEATKRLRESLSEVLTSYPIVTGRLQKTPEGNWMIKCNDAGVRTIEARASGSVEQWLQTADREHELKLTYWEDMFPKPYFWSTFYIQLTEFEGGGIAIGLSCIHLLADAISATQLIKAWADTTLSKKMFNPPQFNPLPPRRIGNRDFNRNPSDNLRNYYKSFMEKGNETMMSSTQKHATVSFALSDEMVKKCMEEAQASVSIPNDSHLTPFAALASLFWLSVSKVKGKKGGLINMSICLDRRHVLGLDRGFFGNCMVLNKVCVDETKEVGLMEASHAVNKAIENMGYEEIMNLVDWLESKRNADENSCNLSPVPIDDLDLMCANWECLDQYSAMFESCTKPLRVSHYVEHFFGESQVLILPSPDKEGYGSLARVAMVTLPENEMVELCTEPLLLSFSPSILMGIKSY